MIKAGKWNIKDCWYGWSVLDQASLKKELEKDVFEFLVQESIKINMKVNQFAISKAETLNCDSEFVKTMQNNSEFITDNNLIFLFFDISDDKTDLIKILLSTKTFDFKSVDKGGYTMLMRAI